MLASITISGYYGFQNIGDEGILDSTIKILRSYFGQDIDITVLSGDPKNTRVLHGVNAVNRWKMRDVYRAIYDSDMLISGGGGLLQDSTSSSSLLYYLFIIAMAKILKKEVYVFAQGAGPITTKTGRSMSRYILNKVNGILLRDRGSMNVLEEIGLDRSRLIEGRDSIFGTNNFMGNVSKIHNSDKVMGVAVRDFPGFSKAAPIIAGVCDYVVDTLGGEIVFLVMHKKEDVESTSIVSSLMKNKSTILNDELKWDNIVQTMFSFNILLGMRLHSLIYAFISGTPHVGVCCSGKISDYMGQVGLPCLDLPLSRDKTIETIKKVLREEVSIKGRLDTVYTEQKEIFHSGVDKLFAQSRLNVQKINA